MNFDTTTAPVGARDEYIIGRGAAWFAFAMTMGLMLFDYIDRQVIVSLFPYLKAEWGRPTNSLARLCRWCRSRWRSADCQWRCSPTVSAV